MTIRRLLAVFFAYFFSTTTLVGEEGGAGSAVLLNVEGAIGPATTDYVVRGLDEAQARGAELVILRLNTPGGLDNAMRDIISEILASPVPVATYVAPSGARAASAGTYILYASHVAAMAPATHLGAATPVQIGGGGLLPGGGEDDSADRGQSRGVAALEATLRVAASVAAVSSGQRVQTGDAAEFEADPADEGEPEAAGDGDEERQSSGSSSAMERKVLEDAVSYIKGLAELRGRNAEWAERAVRDAATASASEAYELNVIDFVVENVDELLALADGRSVKLATGERELATAGLQVELVEPDWRNRLLAVLTNPNVAYILMLIGIYGIFFELMNPGALVPGVLGGVCLLLALYAFQALPIAYAGLALIGLGLAFMIAEAFMPSFGIMGIGGAVAFVLGSIMLMDTNVEGFEISLALIAGFALSSLLIVTGGGMMAARAWRRPKLGGGDELIGAWAYAEEDFTRRGHVRFAGERWNATTRQPVLNGERVKIVGKDGLTLQIELSPED